MTIKTPAIYEKHRTTQQEIILERAEAFFISHNLEKTSISALSAFCGITRSTLYRYFPGKETLLWAIHRKKMGEMGAALTKSFSSANHSTIQRFRLYMDFFITTFETNPDYFLFFDLFGSIYQTETAKPSPDIYHKHFLPGDFGSRDTVRFLSKQFHDGTVNPSLDPVSTAVSVTYSVLYTMVGFSKNHREIQRKYGLDCNTMVRASCNLVLKGLESV